MFDVDVVIVGGGPAGCSSALSLLVKGHSVAIVSTPNQLDKPTETAPPTLRQALRRLNAEEALSACEPCFGICSNWGRASLTLQPSSVAPFGHAWFIHRSRFDSFLQRIARSAGAIWIAAIARNVNFDSYGVSLFTTGVPVRARWLIAATGSPSWLARITQQTPWSTDSLIVFWAHLPVALDERLLFVESTDCGWWYVCPDDGHGMIASFVTDLQSARALGLPQTYSWNELFGSTTLCRELHCKVSAMGVYVAATGVATLPRKCGPRWIAVGDSAAKLDPIGSSGTITALDSGRRAAQTVGDALAGNNGSGDRYARWSTDLLKEFIRQREQQYEIEVVKRASGFWSRRMRFAA